MRRPAAPVHPVPFLKYGTASVDRVPSTDAVKRALAALTTDTARPPYAAVIDEADAARTDLVRAAGFVECVGLDRLDRAVEAAEAAGDDALAERGRRAVAEYRAFRRVAGTTERGGDDHFHPADGTHKGGTG